MKSPSSVWNRGLSLYILPTYFGKYIAMSGEQQLSHRQQCWELSPNTRDKTEWASINWFLAVLALFPYLRVSPAALGSEIQIPLDGQATGSS